MKFQSLIQRLQTYFEDNPSKINGDICLISDDLQSKFSEYKRIKKAVFKRQVEKAYECLSNNDEFIKTIENKIEQLPVSISSSSDSDVSPYEDKNEINKMITDLYKKKSTAMSQQNGNNINSPKKENQTDLKQTSNNNIKKRKYQQQDDSYYSGAKKSSHSRTHGSEFIESRTNFDSYSCDNEIKENIFRRIYLILSPNDFIKNGKIPPRGFLLHGPPGCGKTQLVYAIAGELNLPLLKVTSTELVSGVSGESEENIRLLFEKAVQNSPCILFIDEIEAITQRRENASKVMEQRIVTQLLSCFDDLMVKPYVPVIVIGATSRPDSLDTAFRRAGRFDQEIPVGIPDLKQRKKILEILSRKMSLSNDVDLNKVAVNSPGYVGADLNLLIDEALISALYRRLLEELNLKGTNSGDAITSLIDWIKEKATFNKSVIEENDNVESVLLDKQGSVEINQNDFDVAIKRVQPSSKREGFATVPDITWNDIGALHNVREELATAILAPIKYPEQCKIFNLLKPPGILLVGPPGCGKTLLAKAIANESGVNFISVKGPELLNMYVGESERAVRSVFQRARNSKPCVIFFDEIDSICLKRSDMSGDSGSSSRVVNQMLTEMDGLESRKGVYLMAATNRPDIIDKAILRPGRLDKLIYVGLPLGDDRYEILKTITKDGSNPKLHGDVDLKKIAFDERSQVFTGADLSALVREASEFALKEFIKAPCGDNEFVKNSHFEQAFSKIKPSVSIKDCAKYEKMKEMCVNFQE